MTGLTLLCGEHPPAEHQLALAFLGDAVLALVVAEHLVRAEPAAPVGRLTARRAALVADETLARWAAALELGPLLRLGRGAEQSGGPRDGVDPGHDARGRAGGVV